MKILLVYAVSLIEKTILTLSLIPHVFSPINITCGSCMWLLLVWIGLTINPQGNYSLYVALEMFRIYHIIYFATYIPIHVVFLCCYLEILYEIVYFVIELQFS